jgi:hypothetical protein
MILYDRGVTDDMIRKARLGYHEGRIMIPVYDMERRVVNIRKYLPGAPSTEKMKNMKGYKTLSLYQVEQTKFDTVVICGGEMKALVAGALLNKHKIGAVATTAGEGSWSHDFNKLFKDKSVFVCMDVDSTGKSSARKIAAHVYFAARSVRVLTLPLDLEKYPKGDINDWVAKEKANDKSFLKLMAESVEFHVEDISDEDRYGSEVKDVKLIDASSAIHVNKKIKCEAVISALDENPYFVPKTVDVNCTKDQPNCPYCPIRPLDPDDKTGNIRAVVNSASIGILEMIQVPTKFQREGIRVALRIPSCKAAEFFVRDHYEVVDVRLNPPLQLHGSNDDHVVQPAIITSKSVDLNTPYVITGRVYPHPKTQQSVLVINEVEQAGDTLSTFQPSDKSLKELTIFQPEEETVEGIQKKLDEIYTDIEANVTRIYQRRELHLALDLTYHSPLYFNFDGSLQHGWINCLIAGDSSQGKSEASLRIMEHYNLGTRHDCKNATKSGLLGGLQQMGNKWFISWGVIPNNDRGLAMMEELKGANPEVIGSLTDMRSSGIAEVAKIEKRKAHARTRLIMISNPRSDRPVSSYNFGVEVIKELMGSLEDIRRFDFSIILASCQVDPDKINKLSRFRPNTKHIYTDELCRKLVLWSWTREANQIIFEQKAEQACLDFATDMCSKFSEAMPLCDRGTMRYKLARCASALSNRLYSIRGNDYNVGIVKPCHVEYVYKFLTGLYSDSVFGYEDYSKAKEFADKVLDPHLIKRQIASSKYPKDLVEQMLHTNEITMVDIQDWCELDRDMAQRFLSFMVRKHAVYRVKRWYVKTSEFIVLLKSMKFQVADNKSVPLVSEEF